MGIKLIRQDGNLAIIHKGRTYAMPYVVVENFNRKTKQYNWHIGFHKRYEDAREQFSQKVRERNARRENTHESFGS